MSGFVVVEYSPASLASIQILCSDRCECIFFYIMPYPSSIFFDNSVVSMGYPVACRRNV
jgi:hypothetical protein